MAELHIFIKINARISLEKHVRNALIHPVTLQGSIPGKSFFILFDKKNKLKNERM